jgi:hypothetical protein
VTVDAGLRQRLIEAPAVIALVAPESVSCGGQLPEGTAYPAIACLVSSSVPEIGLSEATGLDRSVVEVDVHAQEAEGAPALATAKHVAAAVVEALHCFRGSWGDLEILGVFLEQQADVEPEDDEPRAGIALQFVVWHRPAA